MHQLFKGNEYWFWMGTDVKTAKISVHVYDSDGNIAEVESKRRPALRGGRVVPKKTGSYYLIVEVEKSPRRADHLVAGVWVSLTQAIAPIGGRMA